MTEITKGQQRLLAWSAAREQSMAASDYRMMSIYRDTHEITAYRKFGEFAASASLRARIAMGIEDDQDAAKGEAE